MPISLPPISRRRFLAGGMSAGAGLLLSRFSAGAETERIDANAFALLADTHIPPRLDEERHGTRPVENLERAIATILKLPERPAAAILAGDCAYLTGQPGDYAMLGRLLKPARLAGLPVHLALGNHDDRANIRAAFPESFSSDVAGPAKGCPADKCAAVLETPRANWFLLDSLKKTPDSPGLLGREQLAWLARELDARPDKPALVLAHHNPEPLFTAHGLEDTVPLFQVIEPRRQVKAYFFGHTHAWRVARQGGIHLVNIPAVAWLFDKNQPRGFLTARLQADRAELTLHALDPNRAKHGQRIELPWRS